MKTIKAHFFNLIEIAMALGIIGFGVASIMSVFPAALQNANNSIGENYASNAAEMFLSYLNATAKEAPDWDGPDDDISTTGDNEDFDVNWSIISSLPSSKPGATENLEGGTVVDADGNIIQDTSNSNIYLVKQGTDFEAVARVWKANTTDYAQGSGEPMINTMQFFGDGSWIEIANDPDFDGSFKDFATAVYVELSWPQHIPYASRSNKKIYYMEFFNPWSLN